MSRLKNEHTKNPTGTPLSVHYCRVSDPQARPPHAAARRRRDRADAVRHGEFKGQPHSGGDLERARPCRQLPRLVREDVSRRRRQHAPSCRVCV